MNFFSYKDFESTEKDADDPEPADDGGNQMEYSYD
jgi:hypothetical protein